MSTVTIPPLSRIFRIRRSLKPFSLVVFSGAQVLDVINMCGLIFSTVDIAKKYDIELSKATWVISAYSLTFGSFILFGGRMADYIGHRTMFTVGMYIVALCSLINATVQNVYVLFVFRALQGVGAACSIPTGFSLVAHTFTGRSQALAFALVGSSSAMGGIIGVIVGGGFSQTSIGYRGLMFLSLGLSTFFASVIYFVVEETASDIKKLKTVDYPGILVVIAGMILVVFGFTSAPGDWKTAKVIATIVIGVCLLAFFAVYETFYAEQWFKVEPLLPKFAWKYPNVAAVSSLAPLHFSNLYVLMLQGTHQIIELRHESAMASAVQFIALGVAFALACVVGGASFGRVSTRLVFVIASFFEIIAGALAAQVNLESYWQFLFPAVLFMGLGTALFMATFANVVTNSAPLKHQGLVSGVAMTGGLLGTSVALAIATSEVGNGTVRKGYQNAYYTLVAYGAVGIIIALVFVKDHKGKVGDQRNHELNDSKNEADTPSSFTDKEKEMIPEVASNATADEVANRV